MAIHYNLTIKNILNTYCNGCHSGSFPSGNIDLTTWANVRVQALKGKLYGSVAHLTGYKAMPQEGNKLDNCKITQINKWITQGALNN